ncbi:MAG: sulfite exporter TauE/SafE family protein [Deltaproteobacteria bacterium]|nr:sulfite exporter TauE/SafE family protein [Deltaproteobacteria bacterium]
MTLFWLLYAVVGAVAGVLAGLLGVGGGLVIVPALSFVLTAQGLPPEHLMHIALGTSLATIMFTSVSSVRAHHKRGAVHWDIVFRIVAGIFLGTFCGSWVAAQLSTGFLKGFFAAFLAYVSAQLLLDIKPKASRGLPGLAGITGVGGIIGVVSSLVGIGGGSLSVPFMIYCNVAVREAIGTSAAIGFPIAIAGTLGYIVNGWHATSLPPHSLGYIYLPALAGVAAISVLTAPLGAKLAHTLPVPVVKKFFAVFLLLMAIKMAWSLF